MPSIEIVDHRYHSWAAVGVPSLLADNAIHGAWIPGEPYAGWRSLDFATHPVMLTLNEKEAVPGVRGGGAGQPAERDGVAGEPACRRSGGSSAAATSVTTGLTTDVYLAEPGDRFVADFGVMGSVEMAFEYAPRRTGF